MSLSDHETKLTYDRFWPWVAPARAMHYLR